MSKNPVWTPANIVTVIRILLIPVFFILLIAPLAAWFPSWTGAADAQPWIAAIAFALISLTDALDGYLARSRNEVTTLGKFMDPLADKILVCAALLALVELGSLPSWIVLIIVAREFIVSGLRMLASSEGMVIAASWFGKAKTLVTMVAIVAFIIKDSAAMVAAGAGFHQGFCVFAWVLMIAAVVLTILSMVDYFVKAERVLHLFSPKAENREA